MTKTISLIADHLGSTHPRVVGTEYCVDVQVNVTDFDDTQGTLTINFTAEDKTANVTAGTIDLSVYEVGQEITISGSTSNNGTFTIAAINTVDDILTFEEDITTTPGDTLCQFTTSEQVITGSALGLSSVHQAIITGQETSNLLWSVETTSDGTYRLADSGSIVLNCVTASTGALKTGDAGRCRLRVFGLI